MDPAYPNGSGRGREIGRIGRIGQIISMGTGLPIRRIFGRGREIGRIRGIGEVDPAYPKGSGRGREIGRIGRPVPIDIICLILPIRRIFGRPGDRKNRKDRRHGSGVSVVSSGGAGR